MADHPNEQDLSLLSPIEPVLAWGAQERADEERWVRALAVDD